MTPTVTAYIDGEHLERREVPTMGVPVTISVAARALGVSVRALRRDLAAGAPVLRCGARGRGRAALLDVDAVAAWRRSQLPVDSREGGDDRLLVLASEIPELIATVMHEAFAKVEGPHKRLVAGVLVGVGYLAITALLDRIRRDAPNAAEPSTLLATLPTKIAHLASHFER